MTGNYSTPIRGFFPRHKRILSWIGHPLLRDALCPIDGCGAKLERCRPRQVGAVVDARPIDGRPALVVREVG